LCRFFLPCRLCFWGVFVPGPREVTEAFWNACCVAVVATGLTGSAHRLTGVTGLTGAGHRSDRCSTGSKPCKFPLCVLVCFGSGGCLLVPRSSSTSVAAWTWPTWVVSRKRVLEAVFVLLESLSPSRRIFIGSHSLPPSLVGRIGSSAIHSYGSCHQRCTHGTREKPFVQKMQHMSGLKRQQHVKWCNSGSC
jgi:hypothetical protein